MRPNEGPCGVYLEDGGNRRVRYSLALRLDALVRGPRRAPIELILAQTKLHRVVGEGQSFPTGEIFVVANEMSFRTVADCFRRLVAAERRGSAGYLAT